MILVFWFFSIIDVSFWLFSIRTRERRYWEGSVHAVHYKSRKSHLQVGRVSWLRDHQYAQIFGSLFCNVPTLSRNVATPILPLSVTSRRGFPTSRRQFSYSLSRRDVNFNDPLERRDVSNQRRDVSNQRRVVDFNEPLEHRDVCNQRRDVFNPTLCNVATLPQTSRRRLVPRSVASRRCPERRDVALFLGQELFILLFTSPTLLPEP